MEELSKCERDAAKAAYDSLADSQKELTFAGFVFHALRNITHGNPIGLVGTIAVRDAILECRRPL